MVCTKCKKEIGLLLMCPECKHAVDFDEYEKEVDERLRSMEHLPPQKNVADGHVACQKCGSGVKIGKYCCPVCKHIVSRKLATEALKSDYLIYLENEKVKEVSKKYRWLEILCWFIPFLGLILRLVYEKSNPRLADLCYNAWVWSSWRIHALVIVLIVCFFVMIFG